MTSFSKHRLKWSSHAVDVNIEMLRPASVGIETGFCVSGSMRLPKAARRPPPPLFHLALFLSLFFSSPFTHSTLSLSISGFLFSIVQNMVDDRLTAKSWKQHRYWQLFGRKIFITFAFSSIRIKRSNKTAIKALTFIKCLYAEPPFHPLTILKTHY